ncbi:MAG: hypothetical protein ACI8RZ_002557 [Myxococcota bacterium]|jgi:hypothetical protein
MRRIPVPALLLAAVMVPLAVFSAEVAAGEVVETLTWAGLIRVEAAEVSHAGVSCL